MERRVVLISLVGTIVLAVAGIAGYVLSGSVAILLDGVFTLVGVPMAIVSLFVLKVSREAPTKDFPVGLTQTRPLLEVFKAIFIVGLLLIASIDAVETAASGGRTVQGLTVVIYAAVASVGCLIVFAVISVVGALEASPLVRLERIQWLQDSVLSAAIGATFAAVTWIDLPIVRTYGRYLDQVLIVAMTVAFLPSLLRTVIQSGRELLLGAPAAKDRVEIEKALFDVLSNVGYSTAAIAIIKSGGVTVADVSVGVSEDCVSMRDATVLRNEVAAALQRFDPSIVSWVSFYSAADLKDEPLLVQR